MIAAMHHATVTKPDLAGRLCTRCALCCDGSLFADVELAGPAEATKLEVMGLEIDDDDANSPTLSLPCRALQGRRCGIYLHRPQCCRTFECRLLQDVRRGTVSEQQAREHVADARSRIGRVQKLLMQLGQRDRFLPLKERCAEALSNGLDDPESARTRAELKDEMSAVEKQIQKVFLNESGRRTRG